MESVDILGVRIWAHDVASTRRELAKLLKSEKGSKIFTPNAEILWNASKNSEFRDLLNSATLLLPDGEGVVLASKILGKRLSERVCGIDTGTWLLGHAEKEGLSVFLLGGAEGVANEAAERLANTFPRLCVCGTHHGYFNKSPNSRDSLQLRKKIGRSCADIVLVCLGSPLQERWISDNAPYLPSVKMLVGLGGSLDIWSGRISRAPTPIRKLKLEWLYRAIREPRRLPRLASLPKFFFAVIRQAKSK